MWNSGYNLLGAINIMELIKQDLWNLNIKVIFLPLLTVPFKPYQRIQFFYIPEAAVRFFFSTKKE